MNEAIKYLKGSTTLALALGNKVYVSCRRGVAGLFEFLDNGTDLHGFYSADRVVGRGAAFLYVLLNVKEVHALVISRCAKSILEENGICVTYDVLVDRILNRDKTGFCPIEDSVLNISDPREALVAIKEKLKQLRS